MPAFPAIRTGALARLADELKFVPMQAARRHVTAAEALWALVEPQTTYPEDWIAARITGFRPDVAEPELIAGEALLADLGAFVERLSVRAEYRTEELAGWLTVNEVCQRWNITKRSLERYKRSGLMTRRAKRGDRRTVLLYNPASVEAFEKKNPDVLAKAGAFSRMSEADRLRIERRAERYARLFKCSRYAAAKRIAPVVGRSIEAVRLALAERDAGASPFRLTTPISAESARLIARAFRVNISAVLIAKRLKKSVAAVTRACLFYRARELFDAASDDAAAESAEKGAVSADVLAHADVTSGLGRPASRSVPEAVAEAMLGGWPDAGRERRLIESYHVLRRRAQTRLASLTQKPSAGGFDTVVTDLRWASRLKAELVRGEIMLLLKTVETQVQKPLIDLEPAEATLLYRAGIAAIVESIDRFDTSRGGRLAAPAGLALSRAVTRWVQSRYARRTAGRAAAMAPAPQDLPDWTRAVDVWQPMTEPDCRLREAALLLAESLPAEAAVLQRRFGWADGSPPQLTDAIAATLGKSVPSVTRREHAAIRAALALWRARQAGLKPTDRRAGS